jgi:hypothetical protein
MKNMLIFDPAMCCSTGVCGPSINPELLRITTVLNNLEKSGNKVQRFNLSNNPQAFIDNKKVNELLNKEGADVLPIIIVDDVIVMSKRYPTNKEFAEFLLVDESIISKIKVKVTSKKSGGCNCKGGCC